MYTVLTNKVKCHIVNSYFKDQLLGADLFDQYWLNHTHWRQVSAWVNSLCRTRKKPGTLKKTDYVSYSVKETKKFVGLQTLFYFVLQL